MGAAISSFPIQQSTLFPRRMDEGMASAIDTPPTFKRHYLVNAKVLIGSSSIPLCRGPHHTGSHAYTSPRRGESPSFAVQDAIHLQSLRRLQPGRTEPLASLVLLSPIQTVPPTSSPSASCKKPGEPIEQVSLALCSSWLHTQPSSPSPPSSSPPSRRNSRSSSSCPMTRNACPISGITVATTRFAPTKT